MPWLSIAALVVCSLLFYLAVESAPELRQKKLRAGGLLAGAAAAFIVTIFALIQYWPGVGVTKFLAVLIPGVTGLACFWLTKSHVDQRRFNSAAVGAMMGLTMCTLAFIVMFGQAPQSPPIVFEDTPPTLEEQLARFEERERQLDLRLVDGIPRFRRKLQADAAEVKQELSTASPALEPALESELGEIARLLLALDEEEKQTGDLIVRVKQEQRRLQRLKQSQTTIGDNSALASELDEVWQETGVAINRPLDEKLGHGAVVQSEIDRKVAELKGDE